MRLATPIYYAFFGVMGAGFVSAVAFVLVQCCPQLFWDDPPMGADGPVPERWAITWVPRAGAAAGFAVAWLLPRMFAKQRSGDDDKLAVQQADAD